MPASAQDQVRLGYGFGLAFLPVFICENLKLIDKHAKALHVDVKANYQRFIGAAAMRDALAASSIDVAPFGTAPLLVAWEKTKGLPEQIYAVSGLTTMPLTLLSAQANLQSLKDFRPADSIAVPALTAPQMYLLEMQSEKILGQYDRLSGQVIAQSPSASLAGLMAGNGPAAAFLSAPYTELALRDGAVHRVLGSADVMGGKASFLIMGASLTYIGRHPQIIAAIGQAIEEAARLIRDEPRRAAQIYLTHEPSRALNGAAIDAVIRDIRDEFGSAVYGVQSFADFMGRHGELKTPPRSWKEIVAPALLNSPSS